MIIDGSINVSGRAFCICPHCKHEQSEEYTLQLSEEPRGFDVLCERCGKSYLAELRLVVHTRCTKGKAKP